jgi:hypothetical protein
MSRFLDQLAKKQRRTSLSESVTASLHKRLASVKTGPLRTALLLPWETRRTPSAACPVPTATRHRQNSSRLATEGGNDPHHKVVSNMATLS